MGLGKKGGRYFETLLFTEAVADSGDYVFLDSTGPGVAGRDTVRREVQLSPSGVAELKALLERRFRAI